MYWWEIKFNEHVRRICSKASAQSSALQRLTGLVVYPSRKTIYIRCIASNFNYCPLVWCFTSRESVDMIDKVQERGLRFVLKHHISNYENVLLKPGFDSFIIYAVKSLIIELNKILGGVTPNYLSELFAIAHTPYDTRDKCKLIQPLERTSTYGLRSFQYNGADVWNILQINIKVAQSLHEFKSLIKSWPASTCSCYMCCFNMLNDWLIGRLYFDWCYSYTCTLWPWLSVWRLCCRLWHRGLSFVTACGATGRCRVITMTAPLC